MNAILKVDYDVIVAGGGLAGLITAASISSFSKQNLKILVVDRNPQPQTGKKTSHGWICGDAVSKRSIDYLSSEIGITYGKPELEHPVKGVVAYSPDHQTPILFDGEGYVLNRKLWPQRQLKDAEKFGVEFKFDISLESLCAESGFIIGVEGTDLAEKSSFKKTARVVVDATGSASKLRQNLPIRSHIQKEIDKENDLEATGRYILDFDHGKEDKTYFDPDYCIIHLDQDMAPGGYAWVFPKGNNKVNIGLGIQNKSLNARNKRLGKKDTLQALIDQYVRENPVISNFRLSDGDEDRGNVKGNWQVPVRRQNDCMVGNGYLLVGDAAWMPRPIDAGGIGPAIYASVIAGRVIAHALESNDASEKLLWNYNVDYMKAYGYQMASFEVLRRYLQTLPNREISYGMKHFLSTDDVEKITKREHPKFDRVKFFNPIMWLRIMIHFHLASSLGYTANKSKSLIAVYEDYPKSPEGFPHWHRNLMAELAEAYQRFS